MATLGGEVERLAVEWAAGWSTTTLSFFTPCRLTSSSNHAERRCGHPYHSQTPKPPPLPMFSIQRSNSRSVYYHLIIYPRPSYKPIRSSQWEHNEAKRKINLAIDTNDKATKDACAVILKGGIRQNRYILKKQYFNGVLANEVSTVSLVPNMTDEQWQVLVQKMVKPEKQG